MFCSVCGEALAEATVIDVLVTRFKCPRGHLFYRVREPLNARIPDPSTVRNVPRGDDRAIIAFWLSNLHARRNIPGQFAEALRRLIEIDQVDFAPQEEAHEQPVRFCFLCGTATERYGRPSWTTGYICANEHKLFERGGHIHVPQGEGHEELDLEPRTWWTARLAVYWLKEGEHTTPYIPASLRGPVERLRHKLGPAE